MRPTPIALVALLACGTAAAAGLLGEEREVLDLFAGLSPVFVIDAAETDEAGRLYRVRSAEPTGRTSAGAVYLRATLTVSSHDEAEAASAAVERRLAEADPDTGLSYAWDYVAAAGDSLVHLHAPCTFSEESFRTVAEALAQKLSSTGMQAAFWCRCGSGCRAPAPFSPGPAQPIRLPPVRRPAGVEEGDYDNRLDPSGAWVSAIGELSLVHQANRLAFSYLAVFGPGAHICEGAGVAGLVGRDRYEYVDEQGTVAFDLAETEVRMRAVDGIASFCGAGWPGDRFTTERFRPPTRCVVATEHSHFHVVDTVDTERTHATVGQGSPVEVVPARHTGDQEWWLGRYTGPLGSRLGLLARGDVSCSR